jgi:hypothetical protein
MAESFILQHQERHPAFTAVSLRFCQLDRRAIEKEQLMRNSNRRISRSLLGCAASVAVVASTLAGTPASAVGATFNFAFTGDMPYASDNVPAVVNAWVADLNADPNIQFVAHSGDFKGGNDSCGDANVNTIYGYFNNLNKPFWYTPGDNDWTDCHRNTNGNFSPLGRLANVRAKYFATPTQTAAGTTHLTVNSQAGSAAVADQEFVENTWFQRDCVTFGDVHSVTSANGLLVPATTPATAASSTFVETPGEDQTARNAEVARRTAANLNWVDSIFNAAAANNSEGVFLMMQAEPNLYANDPVNVSSADEFATLRAKIVARATAFGKPVVVAHGDQHAYTVTQNYAGLANVTRIENWGSNGAATSGSKNWIEMKAECGTPELFSQRTRAVGIAPTNAFTPAFTVAPLPVVPEGPLALSLIGFAGVGIILLVVNRRRQPNVA